MPVTGSSVQSLSVPNQKLPGEGCTRYGDGGMKEWSVDFVTVHESGTTSIRGLSCATASTEKDNEQRKERTRLEGIGPPTEDVLYTRHDEWDNKQR